MHEDRTKIQKVQYFTKIKKMFYSTCRNVNVTSLEDEKSNDIILFYKEKYGSINAGKYIRLLENLKKQIINNSISKNDALIILIYVVDPSFEIYTLYDEICNEEQFKKEILNKFKFYDKDFIELEKKYIKNNNLQKKYSWSYKNEE